MAIFWLVERVLSQKVRTFPRDGAIFSNVDFHTKIFPQLEYSSEMAIYHVSCHLTWWNWRLNGVSTTERWLLTFYSFMIERIYFSSKFYISNNKRHSNIQQKNALKIHSVACSFLHVNHSEGFVQFGNNKRESGEEYSLYYCYWSM